MKKKHMLAGISCIFLIAAGTSYSCSYFSKKSENQVITSLTDQNSGNSDEAVDRNSSKDEIKQYDTPEENTAKDEVQGLIKPVGEEKAESPADKSKVIDIYVHLCGAVENPDVYRLKEGDRLIDAIKLAGGLTKEAAADFINQAETVQDGERIYIPTKEEIKELSTSEIIEGDKTRKTGPEAEARQIEAGSRNKEEKRMNINEADAGQLMELPGIGEAKAAAIIQYRDSNGNFESIEELMNIPGIKEGLFHQIASYITVD